MAAVAATLRRRGRHLAGRRGVAVTAALLPFLLVFAVVLVAPMYTLGTYAFGEGLEPWREFLADDTQVDAVLRTLVIAAQVTAITIVIGYVYVGAVLGVGRRLRTLLLIATVVPFLTSILVRTYGWIVLLGNDGPVTNVFRDLTGSDASNPFINNRVGVLVGMVHVMIPLFVLPLYSVWSQVPANLNRASRTLGANRVTAFFNVDLPISLPGAGAGALLVFVTSLGFFVTPSLLGGPGDEMLSQVIDDQLRGTVDLNTAAVLGVVLLLAVLACIAAFRIFHPLELLFIQRADQIGVRRSRLPRLPDLAARATRGVAALLARLPWTALTRAGALATVVFLLAPLLIVIPISFSSDAFLRFPPGGYSLRWYESVWSDPTWRAAGWSSLVTGLVATAMVAVIALPLAFVLARSRLRAGWKGLLMLLAALPVLFPIITLGLAEFVWFLRQQWIGDRLALAAAQALLGVPFALITIVAALRDFDTRLERASRSLGASWARTLWTVTLPLLGSAIAAGLFFAFLQSFDELIIARNVTDVDSITLPVKIWNGANEAISPALGAVSVLFIVAALAGLALLALARRLTTRKVTRP